MVYQIGGLILGVLNFGVGSVFAIAILALILYMLFRPDPNKKLRKNV
jgi:ferrous iron transport protein B